MAPSPEAHPVSAGFRVDLHVKVLDGAVVERAKARGLDGLVYAPHFRRLPAIRERAARFTDGDLLVVPAREVFTGSWRDRKHVLAVGLEDPVPDFIDLESAMAELRRQGAAVLVPHPGFMTVSLEAADVERFRSDVDGVEVYNLKHLARHNRAAAALSDALDLPGFGSSYAHLGGSVGEVWTTFERPIASAADLVAALRSGAPRSVGHRRGPAHASRRAAELAHLVYENSLSKAALLARGAKPTNPHHPAYGGRFADAACYGPPSVRGFADRTGGP